MLTWDVGHSTPPPADDVHDAQALASLSAKALEDKIAAELAEEVRLREEAEETLRKRVAGPDWLDPDYRTRIPGMQLQMSRGLVTCYFQVPKRRQVKLPSKRASLPMVRVFTLILCSHHCLRHCCRVLLVRRRPFCSRTLTACTSRTERA